MKKVLKAVWITVSSVCVGFVGLVVYLLMTDEQYTDICIKNAEEWRPKEKWVSKLLRKDEKPNYKRSNWI